MSMLDTFAGMSGMEMDNLDFKAGYSCVGVIKKYAIIY